MGKRQESTDALSARLAVHAKDIKELKESVAEKHPQFEAKDAELFAKTMELDMKVTMEYEEATDAHATLK